MTNAFCNLYWLLTKPMTGVLTILLAMAVLAGLNAVMACINVPNPGDDALFVTRSNDVM